MKKYFVLFVLITFGALFAEGQTQKETEAAKIPLENYIKAQATGNPELIRQAFYKDARIMAFRDNKLSNLSVEEFAGFFKGNTAADEATRKRTIESLDVSGNAAIAKITLDYPAVKFTDYMSLLKIDGEWKIVNKSFFAQPRNNTTTKVNFKSADEEKLAITATLETFIQGGKTGNAELMAKVLQTEGGKRSIENGKYSSLTYPEFLTKFAEVRKGKPAEDDAQRKRTIESIDVSGNAAIARMLADYPQTKYFEYMALLKIGDEWKIVSNIYYGEPKAQPKN